MSDERPSDTSPDTSSDQMSDVAATPPRTPAEPRAADRARARARAERVYSRLLRAYPPAYRARFGRGMRETFAHEHARLLETSVRTAAHTPPGKTLRGPRLARAASWIVTFWIVTITQAVWFGLGERLRARRRAARGAPMHTSLPGSAPSSARWAILNDARLALRLLARQPLFTVTAVASLAVGLAASTTVFSLADKLFLSPAPGIRDAARVVDLERTTNGRGFGTISFAALQHLRAHTRTLEALSATSRSPIALSLRADGGSERLYGLAVSASYFDVFGTRPAIGRFFRPEEDAAPDARPVAVLSHRYWRERFQADPGVLSRPLIVNNVAFDVIGVAEAGFEGPTFVGADLWLPMAMVGITRGRPTADLLAAGTDSALWRRAVGRLKPGVTREMAEAELNTLFDTLKQDARVAPTSHRIRVLPSGTLPAPTRAPFAAFVGLLLIVTGGLLLIACSNVAGMLLARASTRQREMATRLAMGAGRGRLVGQLLVETLVLFSVAALVAAPLTIWLAQVVPALMPATPYPLRGDLPIGLRTLGFAGGVALLTGLVFGLAPARHALRADLAHMLHGRSSTDGRDRQRLRHGLVAAQVALALAMVITAGLFVRTLQTVSRMDAGFRTADVDVVTLDTTSVRAVGPEAAALMQRIESRLKTIPAIDSVGYSSQAPLQGGSFDLGGLRVPGAGPEIAEALRDTDWDVVSPDYFRAVGLPILAGRAFTREDRAARPLVAVVNETFARLVWPGQSAIGRQFMLVRGEPGEEQPLEVVGVVKDAKYRTFDEPARPFVYAPFDQHPQAGAEWFIKHAPGAAIGREVRAAITAAEPGLPVVMMQPFADTIAIGLLPQRLAAWIAGVVGLIGLFLSGLGLYGLAAFLVMQRRREIAIRMALGASPGEVRALVLGRAARLGVAGAIAGLLLAVLVGRFIASQRLLVGIDALDPLTFTLLTLALGLVLFAASYLPARSAAATDPARTLQMP